MPAKLRRRSTRQRPASPEPGENGAGDDEVVFKTSTCVTAAADGDISTMPNPQDDVSTVVGSDDEAPDAIDFTGSRQEAEELLKDLVATRQRRDTSRRQRLQHQQERNRNQKLDKQRRMELELSQEILDELAADEAAENELAAAAKPAGLFAPPAAAAGVCHKPKRKRFQYPTPAVPAADFVPLVSAVSTEFRAVALPASALPTVVNAQLAGLRERKLYGGRVKRISARGLRQVRDKQRASGKYTMR